MLNEFITTSIKMVYANRLVKLQISIILFYKFTVTALPA